MSNPPTLPPAERLAGILRGLCEALAAQGVRGTLTGWLLILICNRISRAGQRVLALAARFAAGTFRRRGSPRREAARRTAAAPRAARPPRPLLPNGPGWLLRRVQAMEATRCAVAGRRSQLEHLLAAPDMVALIQAVPPIGRELRPICRMLGVRVPAGLLPPPRRRRPNPPQADQPRARRRTVPDGGPPARPGGRQRPARPSAPPTRPARTPQKA